MLAEKKAKEIRYEGVYLLISKEDQVFSELLVRERYASLLPRDRRRAVRDAFLGEFKNNRFDAGLVKGAGTLAGSLSEAPVACALGERFRGCRLRDEGTPGNSVWEPFSPLAWVSSECSSCSGSWAGSSGAGEGILRRREWAECLSRNGAGPRLWGPGYGYGGYGAAVVSFRACSEDLAELSLATGFTTSSRVTTVAPDTRCRFLPPRPMTHSADPGGDEFVGGDDDGGQGTSWDDPGGATGGDWGGGDGGGDWGGGGGGATGAVVIGRRGDPSHPSR